MLEGAGGAAKAIVVQAALDQQKKSSSIKPEECYFASVVLRILRGVAEQTNVPIIVKDYADTEQLKKDLEDTAPFDGTEYGHGRKKS